MPASSNKIRDLADRMRPHIEESLDTRDALAELREQAAEDDIDYSALKALLKAEAEDARQPKRRVARILARVAAAETYAEWLGLPKNISSDSEEEQRPSNGSRRRAH